MVQKFDEVLALAARQHGVVTRGQLLDCGLRDREIGRGVRAGRLHRVHQGVYAVGRPRLDEPGRLLAAVVARGPRAVLSHRSAAVLWRLLPERGPRIDVTVPTGGGRARRGAVIVHRSPLPREDVTRRQRIPVTTPQRTLVDLADVLPTQRELERAFDEAAYLGYDLSEVRPVRGRRGEGRLTGVLAEHEAGTTRTRTDLEERMLALCRDAALPAPRVNREVDGHEADFVWDAERLIVETDGWQSHGRRTSFESDRVRDAAHVAAGWRVIRVTDRRLERAPEAVAEDLRRALLAA